MTTHPARAPKPPSIRPVPVPPDLVDGSALDVKAGDTRDGERYDGTQFVDRRLSHTTFRECVFEGVSFDEVDLRGLQLIESTLNNVSAATFPAPRSSWRDVTCRGSRLGSAELYESAWRSVRFEACKISYVNARSARWQDVVFADCVIDELDLSYATVQRLAFERCEVRTLELADAKLTDVDLRGARLGTINSLAGLAGCWVTEQQLLELAPLLAAHLQINVG